MPSDDFPVEIKSDEGLYRDSDMPGCTALKHAAVLVPFIRVNGKWHILYIVRAANPKDRHSGQVAFPGGRQDPDDESLIHTALRETHEEIGVSAKHINVIDSLSRYTTVSQYAVTPVVATMHWPVELELQTNEVARTLTIPVDWLRDQNNFTLRARDTMDHLTAKRHPVIVYEQYDDAVLWGATARMTVNCLKAIADGQLSLDVR